MRNKVWYLIHKWKSPAIFKIFVLLIIYDWKKIMKMHIAYIWAIVVESLCVTVDWLKLKSLLLSSCLTRNEPRTVVYFLKSIYKGQFWLQTQNPVGKSCWAPFRVSQKVILYSEWSEVKCCLLPPQKHLNFYFSLFLHQSFIAVWSCLGFDQHCIRDVCTDTGSGQIQ